MTELIGVCRACGTEIAPRLLACPSCLALVHVEQLEKLGREASSAQDKGALSDTLSAWRAMLDLLPPDSRQYGVIAGRVEAMSQRVDREGTSARKASDPSKTPFSLKKGGGVVLALGLLVWKLKAVIGFVATKGKLLLLGLTKSSTLFSMLLSLGVYWSIWGWKFAAGLIACLYVHEMGHVAALRRFGIRASAPMFVPGLGAMVRLHQYPSGPREDARVGLAGPIWGLGASVMACGVFLATGWASWAAIARVSAWINLFNLMPIWQLDGGRGFRALSSAQRWMATAAIAMLWMTTEDSILILLLVAGVYRSLQRNAPSKADWRAFTEYVLVAASLAFLATLHVPGLR